MIPQAKERIEERMAECEATQQDEIKGLPKMSVEECKEYFFRLLNLASMRPLTQRECFLHGQFLSQFRMAVQAEMLGKKGRYYVIDEADVVKLLKSPEAAP